MARDLATTLRQLEERIPMMFETPLDQLQRMYFATLPERLKAPRWKEFDAALVGLYADPAQAQDIFNDLAVQEINALAPQSINQWYAYGVSEIPDVLFVAAPDIIANASIHSPVARTAPYLHALVEHAITHGSVYKSPVLGRIKKVRAYEQEVPLYRNARVLPFRAD